MLKFKNIKLRYQLAVLILIAAIMIIIVQIIYYFSFYNLIQNNTKIFASNIIAQANKNLNAYAENVKKCANTAAYNSTVQDFLNSSNPDEKNKLYTHVSNILRSIIDSNPGVADIAIIQDGESFFKMYGTLDTNSFIELTRNYDLTKLKKPFFTPLLNSNIYFYYIYPIFDTSAIAKSNTRNGVCVVMCRVAYLDDIVKNTSISPNSLFFIADSNNVLVASNKEEMLKKPIDKTLNNYMEGNMVFDKIRYNGRDSLIQYKTNKDMGWSTISIIPINELTRDINPIRKLGIILAGATVLLLTLIGFVFIRSITGPIAMIVNLMKDIGEKNIKQRIVMKETNNEISIIANDVNAMLDKIEIITANMFNMQSHLYEVEINEKEAQISALQSQINPHFLYNTLECIRSISLVYGAKEIETISISMANIFRYAIKGSQYTTIENEMSCIEDYLKIIYIRFMGKISAKVFVEESIMRKQIIKMILQPIVENAVYHGLERKEEEGSLIIYGCVNDNTIEFQITDDGVGMDDEDINTINSSFELQNIVVKENQFNKRGIGLTNINNRIKLYYGNEYGLELKKNELEGVTVVIRFPLLEAE